MNINVNEIINEVLYRYPFLGSVFASIEIVEDYNCYEYHGNPSASASRTKISYHPDFLSSLDREEQITLFAHEGCHILLKHHQRSKGKNPKIWNIATDAIINANLKKDDFKLIPGSVDRPDAKGYSAEKYYQKLLKEQEEQKENQLQNSENNNQEKNEKSQNPSSQEKNEQSNQNSKKDNSPQPSEDYKKYDVGHDTHSNWYTDEYDLEETEKENPETEEIDDTEVFKENRRQQKQRLENLRKNLVKHMLEAGKDTNSENLSFGFVGEKTDLIKWQKLLLDTTKIEEDWSFQNATIEYGVLTPHLEEQPQPETEILIDTSVSVSNNLVRNFLRECKSLLRTSKIRVGCFDTQFYGFQDIRSEEDIDQFSIVGRGGTDFNVAVNSFSGSAENKIIFTDGEASMPDKELNAIWIVYGSNNINPKGGRVIYISEEQLQELDLLDEGKIKK